MHADHVKMVLKAGTRHLEYSFLNFFPKTAEKNHKCFQNSTIFFT